MAEILSEVPKSLAAIGASVGSTWKLIRDVQGHTALRREIREKNGKQGAFFFLCYTLFQYVYQSGLLIIAFASVLGLFGGLLKVLDVHWQLVSFYDQYSITLVIFALLWSVIAITNLFSLLLLLLLGLIPRSWLPFRQSAGWYNLKQFAIPLQHPKPLFLNQVGIEMLADRATIRMTTPGVGATNFAAKPDQLSDDERANTALFGCIIEKEYTVQNWGRRDWAPFYAGLAEARVAGVRICSPAFVIEHAPNIDFYGTIRQTVNQQFPNGPELPDSPVVMRHLSKAVTLLATKYNGSARKLAFGGWSSSPSIRRAFRRACSFQPMDRASMVPQFLKLVVRWDVWPGIEAGNFIYPYSGNLALLILENHALVSLDRADRFAFDDMGQLDAFREAMRRTVKSVEDILSGSNRPDHREYLKELRSTGHPVQWELATRVDFALWSRAAELKRSNGFTQWMIDKDSMIARGK